MLRATLYRSACLVMLPLVFACTATPPREVAPFPRRVLLTNDNGIEDTKLVELARAFARVPGIEVVVVAATRDRSGTSNFLGATSAGRYRVERRDLGPGIEAWALDGYPADCVIFALTGPLRDRLPDVVVSGINGGPNMADDWFGSGTIGAARTAAYFGVPAVAVSGLDDSHEAGVEAATAWVVQFVRSSVVASLAAPEYLTISLPSGAPPQVRGVSIVERARGLMEGRADRVEGDDSAATWQLTIRTEPGRAGDGTDVRAVAAGHIAIVPMSVNEYDAALAARLRAGAQHIPAWIAADAVGRVSGFACDVPFGTTIDDAEDAAGREWGVLLEAVSSSGLAHRLGFRVGDVIVAFNGVGLATERGDPEDPDDRFVRMLQALPCDSDVVLEFVRDGRRDSVRFTWSPRGP
jgi:5'-nucleotidase